MTKLEEAREYFTIWEIQGNRHSDSARHAAVLLAEIDRLASAVPAGPRCPKCQSGMILLNYNLWVDDGKRSRHKATCLECEYELTLDSTPADFNAFFAPSPATSQPPKSEWPEYRKPIENAMNPSLKKLDESYCDGFNDAIDACRAAVPAPESPLLKYSRPECHLKCCEDPAKCKRLGVCHHHYRHAEPAAAQPESTAKVEEIAERIREKIYDLWKRSRTSSRTDFGQASWQGFVREETARILRPYIPSQPPAEFIGDLRRKLFMPYDCAWNGYVRDVTAKLETSGGLVSESEVNEQIYKHCALLMQTQEIMKSLAAPVTPASQPEQFEGCEDQSLDALDFPCPTCKAAPGIQCRNREGRQSLAYCARRVSRARRNAVKPAPVSGNGPEPELKAFVQGWRSFSLLSAQCFLVDCSNCDRENCNHYCHKPSAQPTPKGEKE